ncbi:MAG: hypothetical protein MUF04_13575, partial [Akkermansiaceae bacterium]|nr:hypothetical protein [Akkermansiaceae bacterium]
MKITDLARRPPQNRRRRADGWPLRWIDFKLKVRVMPHLVSSVFRQEISSNMIMKEIEMQNRIASRRSPIRHRVLLLLASFASFAGATTTVHNNGFTTNNQNLPGSPNYASNV